MNQLIFSLFIASIIPTIYGNSQSESSAQSKQSQQIVATKKIIEQEIADFDSFINEKIEEVAENTGIVRVTIMIYKDRKEHNQQDWESLIKKAARSCSRIRRYELQDQDTIDLQEEIETIVHELSNPSNNNGILTEFAIETSDGEPTKGCCRDNCMCVERYNGNCPCSLNTTSNRCLFPQEELPFGESYDDNNNNDENTSEDSSDDTYEEIDLKRKRCCK